MYDTAGVHVYLDKVLDKLFDNIYYPAKSRWPTKEEKFLSELTLQDRQELSRQTVDASQREALVPRHILEGTPCPPNNHASGQFLSFFFLNFRPGVRPDVRPGVRPDVRPDVRAAPVSSEEKTKKRRGSGGPQPPG